MDSRKSNTKSKILPEINIQGDGKSTWREEEYDLGATVGNLTVAVHDIRRQISIYANMLPRQTKWEAQLILYEILGDSTFEKSFSNFDRIVDDVDRITRTIEETPELLTDIQISTLE